MIILPQKQFLTEQQVQQAINDIDEFQVPLKSYNYSIDLFKGYERIFIVGPQRSGTTFTSQALSETLNYRNIDEGEFGVNKINQFVNIIKKPRIVIQAPALTHLIHNYATDKDLVVFMERKWSDILKSLYRKNGKLSNWIIMETMYEVEKYHYVSNDHKIEPIYNSFVDRNSYYLDHSYKIWKHYQSEVIPNCFSLKYESMKDHPLWKNKEQRKNFHPKQIS